MSFFSVTCPSLHSKSMAMGEQHNVINGRQVLSAEIKRTSINFGNWTIFFTYLSHCQASFKSVAASTRPQFYKH